MATGITPSPFPTGFRLIDGSTLNTNFGHPILSSQTGITATASGTQATAYQLTTRVNNVTTVATAGDAIKLPANPLGKVVWVMNNGANYMQVFGSGTNTINAIATATGIAQPVGALVAYVGITTTNWQAYAVLSEVRGTFTANSGSAVTVANTNITANSVVSFGLKTAGGTPAAPFMVTVTPGTGFTVNSGGSDTSVYNYLIVG